MIWLMVRSWIVVVVTEMVAVIVSAGADCSDVTVIAGADCIDVTVIAGRGDGVAVINRL